MDGNVYLVAREEARKRARRKKKKKEEKGGRKKKKEKRPEILEVNAAGAVRVLEFYLALKYIRGRRKRWRSVCVCV